MYRYRQALKIASRALCCALCPFCFGPAGRRLQRPPKNQAPASNQGGRGFLFAIRRAKLRAEKLRESWKSYKVTKVGKVTKLQKLEKLERFKSYKGWKSWKRYKVTKVTKLEKLHKKLKVGGESYLSSSESFEPGKAALYLSTKVVGSVSEPSGLLGTRLYVCSSL
jgi:hypothetical protein